MPFELSEGVDRAGSAHLVADDAQLLMPDWLERPGYSPAAWRSMIVVGFMRYVCVPKQPEFPVCRVV